MWSKLESALRAGVSDVGSFLSKEMQDQIANGALSHLSSTIKQDLDTAKSELLGVLADKVKTELAVALASAAGFVSEEMQAVMHSKIVEKLESNGVFQVVAPLLYHTMSPVLREAVDAVIQLLEANGMKIQIPAPPA